MKLILKLMLSGLLVLLFGTFAFAKMKDNIKADYDQLWSTSVRLIRVDMDWDIVDKDKDAGFIVFLYKANKVSPSKGFVEIIKNKNDPKSTRSWVVQISIPSAGMVAERVLLTNLKKKLREET